MEKAKLGVSVGLLAAVVYLFGLVGGYIVTGLLVGYILLKEENTWLKKQSVIAVILMLAFSVISVVLNIIPNLTGMFNSFIGIFGGYISFSFIDRILSFFNYILNILETVVFVLLGINAFMKGKFKVPVLEGFLDKHMG